MSRRFLAIYPLFLLSGFCGLIYESIWAQYLKLFLGHAAYAQTVVLVVFIGGMAIGAALCGRYTNRLRNPLLLYAVAEFVIGWCAIAFHHIFVFATDWAYGSLLPATCYAEGLCLSSWVFAAALILPQSILLGTTFPLMASGALRLFPTDPGKRIALLYFLNSLGAVFGVLVSAFVFIPTIGLPGASMTAGVLNVALAVAIYAVIDPRKHKAPAPVSVPVAHNAPFAISRMLLAVALLTGLSSFIYEVVWIRMLSLVLGASTQAFELMLASFILGLALGGAWIRTRIDRLRDAVAFLAGVQILMGLLALLTLPLYDSTFDAMAWMFRSLARTDSGFVLFNIGSSLIASAVMLPASLMAGMTLPLITLLLYNSGAGESSLGRVYAANTLGSILGVIGAVHFGLPLLGIKGSLIVAAGIDITLGVVLFLGPARTTRGVAFGWVAAGIAAVAIAPFATTIDPMRVASGVFRHGLPTLGSDSDILFNRDGKTSTISAFRLGAYTTIATNGKPDASVAMGKRERGPSSDEYTMTLAALLPLAYKPDVERVAVIGFGSGMTTAAILGSPRVTRVDTIEIEPAMVEGARVFMPRVDAAFSDPRSHIVYDDAKSYFARSRAKYDLVVSEPSNPWVSGTASLFTEEFYGRVKQSLNPGGLFVQWVQAYEFDARLLGSISNAMNVTFADYMVYQTVTDYLFVARADGPLPRISGEAFAYPQLQHELAELGLGSRGDIDARRLVTKVMLRHLLFFQGAPVNSDYLPFVEANAPRARFRGKTVAEIAEIRSGPVPILEYFEPMDWRSGEPPSQPRERIDIGRPLIAYQSATTLRYLKNMLGGNSSHVPAEDLLSESALATFRTVLIRCEGLDEIGSLWPRVAELAGLLNSHNAAVELDSFWTKLQTSNCASRLPPRYQEWLTLFRAIGNREAGGTALHARSLLEAGTTSKQEMEYLLIAAATGSMAQGAFGDARALFERWLPRLAAERQQSSSIKLLRSIGMFVSPIGAPSQP